MNVRVLAAAVAGMVVFFLLGWLVWGILLADFMKSHTVEYKGLMRDMPEFIPLVIANLSWAALIAFVFEQWAGIRTFVGGLRGGAIIMFFISLGGDLMSMAMMNLFSGYTALIVDVIAATVVGAITGGVIGLVLGKMAPASAAAN
jgi:hypothetical protein